MSSFLSLCCFGSSTALDEREAPRANRISRAEQKRWSGEITQMSEALRSNDTISRLPTAADMDRAEAIRKARTNRMSRFENNPTLSHSFRRASFDSDTSDDSSTASGASSSRRPSFVESIESSRRTSVSTHRSSPRPSYGSADSFDDPKQKNRISQALSINSGRMSQARRSTIHRDSMARSISNRNSFFADMFRKDQEPMEEPDPAMKRISAHGHDIEKLLRKEHEQQIKNTTDPDERRQAVARERKRRAYWNRAQGHNPGR
ncbi:hypothetical protein EJ05DRAFT_474266 [Pseudovirgaria hyperparasitica]|uniref:Uncharacterized protein n=1 Tax=Pseudovirgaria hyperparasitica TaxID=470096 RepID=A0A6A6WEG0_9PEZI|nr:uncharacterized protein EJ05DRAFT_474266 [Pseudovirgaria hyperparasitica]KAF2760380.1 hypothetical protein EJ05DRAFT_474266 [Pseudovirgaria hyperparasitica]